MVPIVLTVAGSDPSGGAGLQADLKTIHQHRAYGAAVATLITAQNTRGVDRAEVLSAELVRAQLDSLLDDMEPQAAKTGALGSAEIVREVGLVVKASPFPWVVDPVWAPTRGEGLSTGAVAEALRRDLIPFATLVTPNAEEASRLADLPVRTLGEAAAAAGQIVATGAKAVLITGGHLEGDARGTDLLFFEGGARELPPGRIVDGEFHGTGCALSSAIAARLAFGDDVPTAVTHAKAWLEGALTRAFAVGQGARPVNHLWDVADKP